MGDVDAEANNVDLKYWVVIVIVFAAIGTIYTIVSESFNECVCDVGDNATAGDSNVTTLKGLCDFNDQINCHVNDCIAYNKYQESIGSESKCYV